MNNDLPFTVKEPRLQQYREAAQNYVPDAPKPVQLPFPDPLTPDQASTTITALMRQVDLS